MSADIVARRLVSAQPAYEGLFAVDDFARWLLHVLLIIAIKDDCIGTICNINQYFSNRRIFPRPSGPGWRALIFPVVSQQHRFVLIEIAAL